MNGLEPPATEPDHAPGAPEPFAPDPVPEPDPLEHAEVGTIVPRSMFPTGGASALCNDELEDVLNVVLNVVGMTCEREPQHPGRHADYYDHNTPPDVVRIAARW